MPRVVLSLLVLAFTVYTLIDCIQTPEREQRNLPKVLWVVLVLVAPVVGGLAWLVAGRPSSRALGRQHTSSRQVGPRGPDDDPDFLRKL